LRLPSASVGLSPPPGAAPGGAAPASTQFSTSRGLLADRGRERRVKSLFRVLLTVSRPIGGILSGPCPDERQEAGVAIHLSGLPGKRPFSGTGRAARLPRLALLRVGFTEPAGSPPSLVRSYRTFSPLPVRTRHPGPAIGGLLSVALSCESPRLASPAPCSAESRPSSTRSRLTPVRAAATRPTHRPL